MRFMGGVRLSCFGPPNDDLELLTQIFLCAVIVTYAYLNSSYISRHWHSIGIS
jgi:hypothetical protein